MTKMNRVRRLEKIVFQQEGERLARWVRSLTDEELARYVTDDTKAHFSLSTLSSEQLARLYKGESLATVLGHQRNTSSVFRH